MACPQILPSKAKFFLLSSTSSPYVEHTLFWVFNVSRVLNPYIMNYDTLIMHFQHLDQHVVSKHVTNGPKKVSIHQFEGSIKTCTT